MSEFNLIIKPDPENAEEAEVYVDGTLDGRAYRFLLDTGAARSSIIQDEYTSQFDSLGKNDSSGVFAAVSDDLITVPRIVIGPISRQNFTLVRAAINPGVKNLIGMDLLKEFCCHFLFDEQRVLVDAEDFSESAYAFEPLFLDRRSHPYINVQFGAVEAKAVWDTGASITLADLNFINSQPAFFAEAGRSIGTDATGNQQETPMFMMSAAVIGQHLFPPHRVVGVDLAPVNSQIEMPMDLILGYSTLSKANWLFDFPGVRWAISKWLGAQI